MKREEQIKQAAIECGCIKGTAEYFGFIQGAQYADRNPKSQWISIKDRLPEDGDVVITRIVHVVKGGGEHRECVQHLDQMYRGRWRTDSMEQHRRSGILYDCISEVTHWMPIPELPEGE